MYNPKIKAVLVSSVNDMCDKTELRMNLAAIRRVDPYAKTIVDSSAHVAFYTFNSAESEWEKTDVEGAFFIYSRNAEPLYSIFINNRLNTNSFVEPVTVQLELQSQPPFLLYRNERSRIRGFWFYNSSECDRIGQLVARLTDEIDPKDDFETSSESLNGNVDIFSMLSRAQNDFKAAKLRTSNSKNENRSPLDVTSQSVMNFFASAKPAISAETPLFQRLLSNPVSVDQIEKQQRAATPLESSNIQNEEHQLSSVNKCNEVCMSSICSRGQFLSNNLERSSNYDGTNSHKSIEQVKREISSIFPLSENTKPALMPPTMFLKSTDSTALATLENLFVDVVDVKTTKQLASKEKSSSTRAITKLEPLTETQLFHAMLYLLKNDPNFIKKLHEAYLKSLNELLS